MLPREGDADVRTETRWYADAPFFNRELFERRLDEEGITALERDEILNLRDDYVDRANRLHVIDPPTRLPWIFPSYGGEGGDDPPPEINDLSGRRRRLLDWLGQVKFKAKASETVALQIPLSVIGAADIGGCTAGVDFYTEKVHQFEWGVTVFGTGSSEAVGLEVTTRAKFTAGHGETKVIFLPLSFVVESGRITKRGAPLGTARRANMSKVKSGAIGILLLAPGAEPPLGERVETYPLAGDTSGAIATYEYSYKRQAGHKLSIGTKAFGADLSMDVEVGVAHTFTVSYDLRGGADYDLHRLREGEGLPWSLVASHASKD